MKYDKLKHFLVLINLGRGAMSKDEVEAAKQEWDELYQYIEYLEIENKVMEDELCNKQTG